MTDKLPHNPEAEKSFLGSMLIDPELIPQARLLPGDFFDIGRQEIWRVILELQKESREIDPVTVHAQLEKRQSQVRFQELLETLTIVPTPRHWQEYETEIVENAYRRGVIQKAGELVKLAYSGEAIQGDVSRIVQEITDKTPRKGKGLTLFVDTMEEMIDGVNERAEHPQEIFGIPTGFIDYDRITGGWQKAQLMIVAGEPGIGKTRFVTQGATYATNPDQGYTGAFFTAEMKNRELALRTVAVEGSINLRNLETGFITDEDWHSFYGTISNLSSNRLYVDETGNPTPDYIDSELARMKANGITFDFVCVDYLFLVAQALMMTDRRLDETQATSMVTARLKNTAKVFDVAVVGISSVIKTGMDSGTAKMGNMRGSGQQLHDGDTVMFITNEESRPDIVTCRFVKGRHLKSSRYQFELINDSNTPRLLNAQAKKIDLNAYSMTDYAK